MLQKRFKNKDYDFYYSYNNYETTIGLEYSRMKKYKELEKYFRNLFNTKLNLSELYIFCWTKNKNSLDPVICTNITDTLFTIFCRRFGIKISKVKFKKFNYISKRFIQNIENVESDITFENKKNLILLRYKDFVLKINKNLYQKLSKRLGKSTFKDEKILLVLMRYYYIGFFSGNQGSVLPQYYKKIRNIYKCDVELFASPMNVYYNYYFGLFYDIEKDFGCLGNVFNIVPTKGFFVANPPFYNNLMNDFFKLVVKYLKNQDTRVTFLITSPVWDIKKRKILNNHCLKKLSTDYKTDLKISLLENSKFNIYNKIWCKEDFPYFNYIKYYQVYYSETRILVISNIIKDINLNFLPKNKVETY